MSDAKKLETSSLRPVELTSVESSYREIQALFDKLEAEGKAVDGMRAAVTGLAQRIDTLGKEAEGVEISDQLREKIDGIRSEMGVLSRALKFLETVAKEKKTRSKKGGEKKRKAKDTLGKLEPEVEDDSGDRTFDEERRAARAVKDAGQEPKADVIAPAPKKAAAPERRERPWFANLNRGDILYRRPQSDGEKFQELIFVGFEPVHHDPRLICIYPDGNKMSLSPDQAQKDKPTGAGVEIVPAFAGQHEAKDSAWVNALSLGDIIYIKPNSTSRKKFVPVKFEGRDMRRFDEQILVTFANDTSRNFRISVHEVQPEKPDDSDIEQGQSFEDQQTPLERLGFREGQRVYVPISNRTDLLRAVDLHHADDKGVKVFYWDGRKKKGVPETDKWVYKDRIHTVRPEGREIQEFEEVELPPFEPNQIVYRPYSIDGERVYEEVRFGPPVPGRKEKTYVFYGSDWQNATKKMTVDWKSLLEAVPAGGHQISYNLDSHLHIDNIAKEKGFVRGGTVFIVPQERAGIKPKKCEFVKLDILRPQEDAWVKIPGKDKLERVRVADLTSTEPVGYEDEKPREALDLRLLEKGDKIMYTPQRGEKKEYTVDTITTGQGGEVTGLVLTRNRRSFRVNTPEALARVEFDIEQVRQARARRTSKGPKSVEPPPDDKGTPEEEKEYRGFRENPKPGDKFLMQRFAEVPPKEKGGKPSRGSAILFSNLIEILPPGLGVDIINFRYLTGADAGRKIVMSLTTWNNEQELNFARRAKEEEITRLEAQEVERRSKKGRGLLGALKREPHGNTNTEDDEDTGGNQSAEPGEYHGFNGKPETDKVFLLRNEEITIIDPNTIPEDEYSPDNVYFLQAGGVINSFPRSNWNDNFNRGNIRLPENRREPRNYDGFTGAQVGKTFVDKDTGFEFFILNPNLVPDDEYDPDYIYGRQNAPGERSITFFSQDFWNTHVAGGRFIEKSPTRQPVQDTRPEPEKFEGNPQVGKTYVFDRRPIFIEDVGRVHPNVIRFFDLRFSDELECSREEWAQEYTAANPLREASNFLLNEIGALFRYPDEASTPHQIGDKFIDPSESNAAVEVIGYIMGPKKEDRKIKLRKIADNTEYMSTRINQLVQGREEIIPPRLSSRERGPVREQSLNEVLAEVFEKERLAKIVKDFTVACLEDNTDGIQAVQKNIQNIFDSLDEEKRARMDAIIATVDPEVGTFSGAASSTYVARWKEHGWRAFYNVLDNMVGHDLVAYINGSKHLRDESDDDAAHGGHDGHGDHHAKPKPQKKGLFGSAIGWASRAVRNAALPVTVGGATVIGLGLLFGGALPLLAAAGATTGTLAQRWYERFNFGKKHKEKEELKGKVYSEIADVFLKKQDKEGADRCLALIASSLKTGFKGGTEAAIHEQTLTTRINDLQGQIQHSSEGEDVTELRRRRVLYMADRALFIHDQNNPVRSYTATARKGTNHSTTFTRAWGEAVHGVEDGILRAEKFGLHSQELHKQILGDMAASILNAASAGAIAYALPGMGAWARAGVRALAVGGIKGTEAMLHERSRRERLQREQIAKQHHNLLHGDIAVAERGFIDAKKVATGKDIALAGVKRALFAGGMAAGLGAGVDPLRGYIVDALDGKASTNKVETIGTEDEIFYRPDGTAIERVSEKAIAYGVTTDLKAPVVLEEVRVIGDTGTPVAPPEYTVQKGDGINSILNHWQQDTATKATLVESLKQTHKDWVRSADLRGRALGFSGPKLENYINDRLIHSWRVEVDQKFGVMVNKDGQWQYTKTLHPGDKAELSFDPAKGPVVEITRGNGSELKSHAPYTLDQQPQKEPTYTLEPARKVQIPGDVVPNNLQEVNQYILHRATDEADQVAIADNVQIGKDGMARVTQLNGKVDTVDLGNAPFNSVVQPVGRTTYPPVAAEGRAVGEAKGAAVGDKIINALKSSEKLFDEVAQVEKTFQGISDTARSPGQRVGLLRDLVTDEPLRYGSLDFKRGIGNNISVDVGGKSVLVTSDNIDQVGELAELGKDPDLAARNATEIKLLRDELTGKGKVEVPPTPTPVETPTLTTTEDQRLKWLSEVVDQPRTPILSSYNNNTAVSIREQAAELDAAQADAETPEDQAHVAQIIEDFMEAVNSGSYREPRVN